MRAAIATLAANPPPDQSIADAQARVFQLESQLGRKHSLASFNPTRINARIIQLEAELAANGQAPAIPAKVAPVVAQPPATVPTVPAAMTEGDLTATAAEFIRLGVADQAAFAQNGGKLLRSEFAKLTPAVQLAFCKSGGKLIEDPKAAAPDHSERRNDFGRTGGFIPRAQFDAMTPQEKLTYCQTGGRISD